MYFVSPLFFFSCSVFANLRIVMGEEVERLKKKLFELQAERESCLKDIREAEEYLAGTPVGLRGRLIDEEGFPRADCDLYAVRSARNKHNCRSNDLKDIEETMYTEMMRLQDLTRDVAAQQMTAAPAKPSIPTRDDSRPVNAEREAMLSKRPFLRIVDVKMNSPAWDGGLRDGFEVVQYDDIDSESAAENWRSALQSVTAENAPVTVWARTPNGAVADFFLVPRQWEGNGLLGCSFEAL
ncbi:26S proteasome non-ATPase regulatory subunit 9 [Angomonas deanei]|nr:26S proteasome non-ATPase regulatory subunit 9 [Angomonas deanei]|eukprot:EPY37605.1 26S proteasome non-ATPase regulatory subunit 9 [Angomonas deanei]